jgi:hypothetical protein
MEKGVVNHQITFPPYDQTAIIAQPGKGSFDFPSFAITTQGSTILSRRLASSFAMRTNQFNPPRRQPSSQRIAVIAPAGDQPDWFSSQVPGTSAGYGNRTQCLFEERDLSRGRRVQVVSQRKTLAVDHHHPLRPFAPPRLPDRVAPFFAGAKLPSAKASLQSNWPLSSRSARKARQAFNHTPCSSHRLSRRQQVEGLGYWLGRSHHGAPVRNTHKIPSKTCRCRQSTVDHLAETAWAWVITAQSVATATPRVATVVWPSIYLHRRPLTISTVTKQD